MRLSELRKLENMVAEAELEVLEAYEALYALEESEFYSEFAYRAAEAKVQVVERNFDVLSKQLEAAKAERAEDRRAARILNKGRRIPR